MNRSARTWLLFMMVPFLVGVIIHFLVPLQFIITSNPKIQEAYNSYKIEVEQNTVRALAFLNSKVVNNRMQMYENIRSTFVRLFDRGRDLQPIDINMVSLNSARELAQQTQPLDNDTTSRSMWYSPTATDTNDFNPVQKEMFTEYQKVEPFIRSIYNKEEEVYRGLLYLETTVLYGGEQLYFYYPSKIDSAFNDSSFNLTNSYYLKTIFNYEQANHPQTMFDDYLSLKNCIPMLSDSLVIGTICIGLDIQSFVSDITSSLSVPEFELSTNDYYLTRPLYAYSESSTPQILANFSNDNLQDVEIPFEKYISQEEHPLPMTLFLADVDYQLNIQRLQRTKTYYIIPISTYNHEDIYSICMYLIVVNNFAKAQIQESSHYKQILTLMIVPSILLLILSVVLTTIVLKSLLNQLDSALSRLSEYCALIIKEDLNLQIPEYEGTSDLKHLFEEFETLNKLNKYSDPKYFKDSKPQRLIKYLNCLTLFEKLGYNTSNLCENISDCYKEMEEYENSIRFIKDSIQIEEAQLHSEGGGIDAIFLAKTQKVYRYGRQNRQREKLLRRKIIKLVKVLYASYKPDHNDVSAELTLAVDKLKKVTFPRILNNEYVTACIIQVKYKFRSGDFTCMREQLEELEELIEGYEQVFAEKSSKSEECWTHPNIMRSNLNFLKAGWSAYNKDYLKAFDFYVESLSGNYYNPNLHKFALQEIEKILQLYKIDDSSLKNLKFREQEHERGDREYIFLIDVSNPAMNDERISKWKKKARKMAEFILTHFIAANDRVGINEFCHDTCVVCNLSKVGNQIQIIRKELIASFKCRQKTIYSQIIQNLQKSAERVKHLAKQKVFIIFLKGGHQIHGNDIFSVVAEVPNSIFLFITEESRIVRNQQENFYVVGLDDKQDVERILQKKEVRKADNMIYLL